MPSKPWPIWCYSIAFFVGVSLILTFEGGAASDGIPPGLPFFAVIVFLPTWLALRRYNPETRLLVWRIDRPVRSATVTFVCLAAFSFLMWLAIVDSRRSLTFMWDLLLINAAGGIWLLLIRAAAIDQLSVRGGDGRIVVTLDRVGWRRVATFGFVALSATLLLIWDLSLRLHEAREHFHIAEHEQPFVDDALRRAAAYEGVPRSRLLDFVFPIVMKFPDRTCVETRSRPGVLGQWEVYCYLEHDLSKVQLFTEFARE